jgi:hypothetical protein
MLLQAVIDSRQGGGGRNVGRLPRLSSEGGRRRSREKRRQHRRPNGGQCHGVTCLVTLFPFWGPPRHTRNIRTYTHFAAILCTYTHTLLSMLIMTVRRGPEFSSGNGDRTAPLGPDPHLRSSVASVTIPTLRFPYPVHVDVYIYIYTPSHG